MPAPHRSTALFRTHWIVALALSAALAESDASAAPFRRRAASGQPGRRPIAQAPASAPAGQPTLAVDDSPLAVVPERAFDNLKFQRPVLLTHAGDGSNRIFVASQLSAIHVFPNDPGVEETKVFLDLTKKTFYKDSEFETGVLGLAFHPQFKDNGQFFVYYTASTKPYVNVVSRFAWREYPDAADLDRKKN